MYFVSITLTTILLSSVYGTTPTESCSVESLSSNTILIRDKEHNSELIIVGHYHRNYFVIDKFSQMIRDAAQYRDNRVELRKALDDIKKWNNSEVNRYFKKTSGPVLDQITSLVRERNVDFIGIESPYVTASTRIESIREVSNLYTELAKEAYGTDYLRNNLRTDLAGMFGADWYHASIPAKVPTSQGVDSSLLEKNFGDGYQDLANALNTLDAVKIGVNREVLTYIIQALASGRYNRSEILSKARLNLSVSLVAEVEKALAAREKMGNSFDRRDLQMLKSMKARTNRAGLLVVGSGHIASLREQYKIYCQSPRSNEAIEKLIPENSTVK